MNNVSFDALARDAAGGISRRTALGTLGGAGLAALATWAGVLPAAAKKKGTKKRRGNTIDEIADQKCALQKDQCLQFFKPICAGNEECAVDALRCCPVAGECDIIGFVLCINE